MAIQKWCFVKCIPHFKEDLPDLSSHFHQGVEVSSHRRDAQGIKIVCFEGLCLPWTTEIVLKIDMLHSTSLLFTGNFEALINEASIELDRLVRLRT